MLPQIVWKGCDSGNFARGRGNAKIEAIVIHVMDGYLAGTDALFNTAPAQRKAPLTGLASSAHYGIGKGGEIHQYVEECDIAYHAGRVVKPTMDVIRLFGAINPNYKSIGIEHEGFAADEWTEKMYAASATLIADIAQRHCIPLDRQHVFGHREVYALKTCPGKGDVNKLIEMAKAIH